VSQPAPLWEWVRACEESALGAAHVCNEQVSALLNMFIDAGGGFGGEPGPSAYDAPDVWLEIDIGECRVYLARDEGACHGLYTTPAELRAALDALAKEVEP